MVGLLNESSDDDIGDNSRRERMEKQELEELDRRYFIQDESMDDSDAFYNKAQAKYGTKKHHEELPPLKSPFIQLGDGGTEESGGDVTEMSRAEDVEGNTVIDGPSGTGPPNGTTENF